MELREWAIHILSADRMEDKLFEPKELTDQEPGGALFWKMPTRPPGMEFKRHTSREKLPSFQEHNDSDKRAVCLHRFAGHELLAVEIMAYALLAFPEAPKHFRKGVANTLKEEQGHVRLYVARMEEMGLKFGDLPLYRHFWAHIPYLTDPLRYISVMSLTFEMANLDFAPHYGKSFASHGDEKSAKLMQIILQDEIQHVSFGYNWLKKMKGNLTDWEAWEQSLPPLMTPKRARGFIFNAADRIAAGLPQHWIDNARTYNPVPGMKSPD